MRWVRENFTDTYTIERSNMGDAPDIKEPLHVKREDVIAKLQENLDAERAKRHEEHEKQKQARLAVNQFVYDHADEVVGYLGSAFGFQSWTTLLEQLEKAFDPEKGGRDYHPVAIKPTRKENDLEKFVRVLSMATNETLEITPDQQLYSLL